jgi:1,4-alpha-glucan branching enzyme
LKETFFTREIFNSDDIKYGGSGSVNNKVVKRTVVNKDEKKYKLIVNLPPLSGIILK